MSLMDNLQVDVTGAKAELVMSVDGAPFRLSADFGAMASGQGHVAQITLEDVDGRITRIAAGEAAGWLRDALDGGATGEAATGLAGRVVDAASAATALLRTFRGLR